MIALASLALALVGSALLSGVAHAATLEEIRACLAANVPKKSSALSLKLLSLDRAQREYAHQGRVYWSRSSEGISRTLVCMTSPRDIRGLAYLIHERESGQTVWAYLPEEERVLRINPREAASRGRIARTAISYEDLRYLPLNLSAAQGEQTSDTKIGDRPVSVVLLSLAPGTGSLYDRVVSFVDQQTCVPLKIEQYALGGKLRKVTTANPDTIIREGATSLARSLKIEDLKRGVETEILIEKVQIDADLPERLFTPSYLKRGRCAE